MDNAYNEILRYMGHTGASDAQLEALVSSCLEKLVAVSAPRHVADQLPCSVTGSTVKIETLMIESEALAGQLRDCTQAVVLAATLGAPVDRLITQRAKIDSAEALCLQACAAAQIEDYCNRVEHELSQEITQRGCYLRPRFSPGYSDFSNTHQTGILRMLQAHKRIGLTETKTHMLTPLKSVTAVIGVGTKMVVCAANKCTVCGKANCSFRVNKQ